MQEVGEVDGLGEDGLGQDLAQVDEADNRIGAAFVDGHAGVAAAPGQLGHPGGGGVDGQHHEVRAGDHHRVDVEAAEVAGPAGDLVGVGVDRAGGAGLFDDLLVLVAGEAGLGEGGAVTEQAQDEVAAKGEQADGGAGQPGKAGQGRADEQGVGLPGAQGQGLGLALAQHQRQVGRASVLPGERRYLRSSRPTMRHRPWLNSAGLARPGHPTRRCPLRPCPKACTRP